MSLSSDLLSQAYHLVGREPRRPKQASLRRAVSTAYYALFHLLAREASELFSKDEKIVVILNRVYSHSGMHDVSKSVARGDFPKLLNPLKGSNPVPAQLMSVAQTFVDIQQARHEADYNLAKDFARNEVRVLLDQVKQAFHDWSAVRKGDYARLYLGSFLLWDTWSKVR